MDVAQLLAEKKALTVALEAALKQLGTTEERLAQTKDVNDQLTEEIAQLNSTLDLIKLEYLKLQNGLKPQGRERPKVPSGQLTLAILGTLLGKMSPDEEPPESTDDTSAPDTASEDKPPKRESDAPKTKRKRGRKALPENLERITIELIPDNVQRLGLDAFERIGEEVSEVLEHRSASKVVLRIVRPKFVRKDRESRKGPIDVADPIELPIPKGLAGPGMLAHTIVSRWQDSLPLHRLESIYARDGIQLARSTMCGWHLEMADRVRFLLHAMWEDALKQPYLCTDATGVLVQAKRKCRKGHFWVVVAPMLHVLFGYSRKHDGQTVDDLLAGYSGHLISDAHSVYDHLGCDDPDEGIVLCGCFAHARRYYFNALVTDPTRARVGIEFINKLFVIERGLKGRPPDLVKRIRRRESKPIVDAFFAWTDTEYEKSLDGSPIKKALTYSLNQEVRLRRFLENGALPMHNNISEMHLRRMALGRKNWLFLGSDNGGYAAAMFASLLASCRVHNIEPWAYLRDLFCLMPNWNQKRVLELAPAYWRETTQKKETQRLLESNVFRRISTGARGEHLASQ